MNNKEITNKVLKIANDYKSHSNKDLMFAMDFIKEDFEKTKESIIKLTHHLDKLENSYNLILNEYETRNNKKQL